MRLQIGTLSFFLFCLACVAQNEKVACTIIPQVNQLETKAGSIKLSTTFTLGINNAELEEIAKQFITDIRQNATAKLGKYSNADVRLELNNNNKNCEAYTLTTSAKQVTISASSAHGIFNGLQSLKQLLLFAPVEQSSFMLPNLQIKDSPRFGWRGLMLDESRYFFGGEKIKQLLDLMAMHKLNVFHWHLTDDPGWRMEIKQYPKLATVGGLGNDLNANAPAQYYTQEQIREIVKYAADRFITIIPEIDMPGHARAANRAYPEYSGGGSKSHPDFTFNPGYEPTYTYLTNILREVCDLFPSNYIHLGGDEVHFGNEKWNTNKHVQKLMKEQELKTLREVEEYFINRMADSIKSLNKTVIGWDEIVDFELDKDNSVVMWWRHDKPQLLGNALTKNYQTILCPRIPLYFDFDQDQAHKYGRKWGRAFSPNDMVYAFPPETLPGFSENMELVKGIQANLWTERIQSEERFDYMTHPRLSAMAEAAWTLPTEKDYQDFNKRLKKMLSFFETENIHFYNPFNPEQTPEPIGRLKKRR